ncbi:hypothetical protein [Phytobacter diazotrophicus]|uniref:hypothetical protein n=1 Tax=Phytobacter diazotrophicus TaxID=395631 RepID=UPI002FEE9602
MRRACYGGVTFTINLPVTLFTGRRSCTGNGRCGLSIHCATSAVSTCAISRTGYRFCAGHRCQ